MYEINKRFLDGRPSSNLSEAGVLVRGFDAKNVNILVIH